MAGIHDFYDLAGEEQVAALLNNLWNAIAGVRAVSPSAVTGGVYRFGRGWVGGKDFLLSCALELTAIAERGTCAA